MKRKQNIKFPGLGKEELPIFQTRENKCYIFIEVFCPNGNHIGEFVRQMFYGSQKEPHDFDPHVRNFQHEQISLGPQISDFKLIYMSLE